MLTDAKVRGAKPRPKSYKLVGQQAVSPRRAKRRKTLALELQLRRHEQDDGLWRLRASADRGERLRRDEAATVQALFA